jgi:hypothetical protein
MPGSRVFTLVINEFRELLPTLAFFFVSFNLVELTTQLILADYHARLANFMIATTLALVVGKAVLVANVLPFLHRFDTAPLIRPIIFKTMIYWVFTLVARFLEQVIENWIRGEPLSELPEYAVRHFSWHRFTAIQIWIFVLFLVYTFVTELNTRLGNGKLVDMLFTTHSSEPKPARQQRV